MGPCTLLAVEQVEGRADVVAGHLAQVLVAGRPLQ
jgi:hypothetical protein